MSQKKAAPQKKPVAVAKAAAKPAAGGGGGAQQQVVSSGPPRTVAFDRNRLEAFVMGRITLGEMEGVQKDTQYEMAKKGFKMIAEGKLDLARAIFKGLIALDPFDSYFHMAFGAVEQRSGNYEDAEAAYTRALKFNAFNTTALANRGEVRFQMGKVLEAAQDIKEAIEKDPQGKDPATLRARVLSMAIAEVIRENQDVILSELKKAAPPAAARGAKGKPVPAKPAPKGKPAPHKKK